MTHNYTGDAAHMHISSIEKLLAKKAMGKVYKHRDWELWTTQEYMWGGSAAFGTCHCFKLCWWAQRGTEIHGGYSSGGNHHAGRPYFRTRKAITSFLDKYRPSTAQE